MQLGVLAVFASIDHDLTENHNIDQIVAYYSTLSTTYRQGDARAKQTVDSVRASRNVIRKMGCVK